MDGAVLWFGATVEAHLQERTNAGSAKEPKWESKYTLEQLLDPAFRVPRPLPPVKAQTQSGLHALVALAKQGARSGVKLYRYAGPEISAQ